MPSSLRCPATTGAKSCSRVDYSTGIVQSAMTFSFRPVLPRLQSEQSFPKDSNLARTAARYKIDSAKIATAGRAELSKAKASAKDESQAAKKPTPAISSRNRLSKTTAYRAREAAFHGGLSRLSFFTPRIHPRPRLALDTSHSETILCP
jgi:hypothetical protein